MKKVLIFIIAIIMLIFFVCSKPWESYKKSISKNDTVTYGIDKEINTIRLKTFINNVDKGKKDRINIVNHTVEGDPIITQLYFNGINIKIYTDISKDQWGGPDKNKITYNTIHGGKHLKADLLKYLKDDHITY